MAKILVVDDHEESRKLLMRILQRGGHSTVAAATAFEALEAVQVSNPDLILLDVLIPPVDGLSFLSHLRENPKHLELPVITVSGLTDSMTISAARELGVKAHLVKTQFTSEQLLLVVNRYIRSG